MNLTAHEEKYAQELFNMEINPEIDLTQLQCFKNAYPKQAKNSTDATLKGNASVLANSNKIVTRLKELRKPIVEKAQRTLETILDEIDSIKTANLNKDDKLALDCLKHEAKLKGYEIDKRDLTSGGEPITMPTIVVNGKKQIIKMGD